jgi:hypothetical protein
VLYLYIGRVVTVAVNSMQFRQRILDGSKESVHVTSAIVTYMLVNEGLDKFYALFGSLINKKN